MQILIADKLGRIRFMQLAAIIVTIGATIQTASQNLGMFLAGRIISGIAVGSVLNFASFWAFFFYNIH
jgi:predicted MFS family arabinose efflux permease